MRPSLVAREPTVEWAAQFCPEVLDLEYLQILVDALQRCHEVYLRRHPETPPLDVCGVRYVREPSRRQRAERWWWTPDRILRFGVLDCKAAGAWRAAELVVWAERGLPGGDAGARAVAVQMTGELFHVPVLRSDGTLEDPSLELGLLGGRGWSGT